jgi:hypothetical protein
VHVLGVIFVGTSTRQRPEMVAFLEQVLELPRRQVADVEADLFALPDGSTFAIAWPGGMGESERSIGLLVADLEEAMSELRATGVSVGEMAISSVWRYAHFVAPDGQLYELIERLEA